MLTNIRMLEQDKIDVSEVINVDKFDGFREYIICHFWYFLEINFRFKAKVCSSCHNLMQKVISFNNVAIVSVKVNEYRIHFWYMSKDKAISILNNINLKKKSGSL